MHQFLLMRNYTNEEKECRKESPLRSLLSNILLDELNKELKRKGLPVVRYANDSSIYTKSTSEAKKAGNGIYFFLNNKLYLPINREIEGIRRAKTL